MKNIVKSTLLVLSIVFSGAFNTLSAQENTETEEKDNKKSYKTGDTFLERISLTGQVGWLHSWGDFKKDGFMPSFLQGDANELGLGLNLNYNISRVLSVSGGLLYGELEGAFEDIESRNATNTSADYGRGIFYQTDIFEVTLPRVTLNATRLIFKNRAGFFNKASFNLFASHGLVYYNSKIYAQGNPEAHLLYGKERGRTGQTTEAVTSFGGSFSYILNDRFDISLESSIRNVYNDKLDAWVGGDYNDKYSFTAVGVTYYIKKRKYVTREFDLEENQRLAEEVTEESDEKEVSPDPILEDAVDDEEVVDLENPDKETVFGVYTYDKLPGSNTALVVLDENGIPIDTIYTDEKGFFKYDKLNMDEEVSFVPLNYNSLDDDQISLYLTDKEGNKVKELNYDKATGGYNTKAIVVVEEDEEEKQDEIVRKDPTKDEPQLEEGNGYYVTVAAFRSMTSSRRMVLILEEKGEKPSIIRNRKDTWNLITIARYDDKKTAIKEMKQARKNGYPNAWVHIKPEDK